MTKNIKWEIDFFSLTVKAFSLYYGKKVSFIIISVLISLLFLSYAFILPRTDLSLLGMSLFSIIVLLVSLIIIYPTYKYFNTIIVIKEINKDGITQKFVRKNKLKGNSLAKPLDKFKSKFITWDHINNYKILNDNYSFDLDIKTEQGDNKRFILIAEKENFKAIKKIFRLKINH